MLAQSDGGLLFTFIAVTFECILTTVGKKTRGHTAIRRLDGKTSDGAPDEEAGGENVYISLATYLFFVSVIVTVSILVLRDLYGWLQGERYWWMEMAVVMFVIPFAIFLGM